MGVEIGIQDPGQPSGGTSARWQLVARGLLETFRKADPVDGGWVGELETAVTGPLHWGGLALAGALHWTGLGTAGLDQGGKVIQPRRRSSTSCAV